MKEVPVTSKNVKIGLKVKRGRDWHYGDQDENSKFGVISSAHGDKWYWVKWDKGPQNAYRVGDDESKKCDLYIYKEIMVKPGSEAIVKKALRMNRLENITEEMLIENGLQEHLI